MKIDRPGYVLVTVLAILALAIILVTRLLNDSTVQNSFTFNSTKTLKAQQLALSGVEIAKSIIQKRDDDEKGVKQAESILKYLNSWHKIEFDQDNINNKIEFYLSSENGKCSINKCLIFGASEEQSTKKVTETFNCLDLIGDPLSKILGANNIVAELKQWAKKSKIPLNDLTELLAVEKMAYFKDKIFIDQKTEYALTDIFSLGNGDGLLQPWLLSASMCRLLGLKTVSDYGVTSWRESLPNWLKKFSFPVKWEESWDEVLAPIYGKKWSQLPSNMASLFATSWNPTLFSVVVKGTFDDVSSSLFAVITADKTYRLYLI